MASTQQSSNGKKLTFKPVKSSSAIKPNIPAGKWYDSELPRGQFKVSATKKEQPMLSIPIKLGKAEEEENSSYKGASDVIRIVFYPDDAGEMTKAANMSKLRLRALCEAVDVDYDEVYPASIENEDDLDDLIEALSGKVIPELWTVHRAGTMPSGEETINVDFYFKEPGSGLAKRDDEGDEKPARGNKVKKSSRR